MCNININYRSAIILKQALREKIEIKNLMLEKDIPVDNGEIKYLEQEIRTLTDFTNKIENKWGERKKEEKIKHNSINTVVEKENTYLEIIKRLI